MTGLRRSPRRGTRSLLIAAWAVPVLVLGQFAMLALVPVVLVGVRTARDARLRWWAVTLGVAYATPLVMWAIGPDRAPSLSKDMSPVVTGVLVAVSTAVALAVTVTAARRVRIAAV